MAFGKRPLPATAQTAPTSVAKLPPERPSEARHAELRDRLQRILADVCLVAVAIRENGTITVTGVADVNDPSASPVPIVDLVEHFSFAESGQLMHPFFAYAPLHSPEQLDPATQFQLLDLVTSIRELNVYCQEGHRDEALAVALQSPKLPPLVDRILVAAAFFTAYFENLGLTHSFVSGAAGGKAPPGFAKLQTTFDRYKLMATDHMIDPTRHDALRPAAPWPHLGVEIARRHENGEQFVHGIYFPATYARKLIDNAGRSRKELAVAAVTGSGQSQAASQP